MNLLLALFISAASDGLMVACGYLHVSTKDVPATGILIGTAAFAAACSLWVKFKLWTNAKQIKTAETISPGITRDGATAIKVAEIRKDARRCL